MVYEFAVAEMILDADSPPSGKLQLTICPVMVEVLDPFAGVHEMTI